MLGGGIRTSLGAWTLALALAGVAAGAGVSYVEVRHLAREEAEARVTGAAERARSRIDERLRDLDRSARLLAERPTLARLIAAADGAALADFLERFRATSGLDAVRLTAPGIEVGRGDPAALERLAPSAPAVSILTGRVQLVATQDLPPAGRVEVAAEIEAADFALPPLAVGFLSPAEIEAGWRDANAALRRTALERGAASALRPAGATAERALPGAPASGVVEVTLEGAVIDAPADRLAVRAAWVFGAVALLAVVASSALAASLARPIDRLRTAAARLGRGDFETPIPTTRGGEVGELERSLEGMRERLARTTGELEHRRGELETVLAGISEGVFAVDRDRRVHYLSPRAAALLDTTPEAAIGSFCGDLLRPEPIDGRRPCDVSCPIVQARSRGTARAVERLGRLAGGSWNAVLTSAPPSGELQVLIVHAESADDAARRARDAVVGDLAHELTTPLAAQAASLELLRERLAERDREALDLVLALEAGTFRLRRMIDNLLESVRIEAGQLAIRRLAVDLDEVVEESVALTQPLLERRGQRLELDLPHPMPPLTGDPQRLTQVLVNLLANASKFGPEASTVRLAVRQSGAAVELTVDDEGPGLDPATANAPRRFVRGGVEPPEPGSGLGLWICRSILERHGGGLRVEPRARGARLVASLPAGAA